jgi:hypothetical protein
MNITDVKEFVVQRNGLVKAIPKPEYDMTTHPIKANSVAIVERCELGEHCRCKSFDVAYKADCWNWIGEVKL